MSPTRRMLLKSLVGVAAAAVVGTAGTTVPEVVQDADGSGLLTFTSLRTTKARSMRLDPAHAAAFFDIFREEDNKR